MDTNHELQVSPRPEHLLHFIGLPGYSSRHIRYAINGNLGELETSVEREIYFENAQRDGTMAVERNGGGPGTPKTPPHRVWATWCFNSVFFFFLFLTLSLSQRMSSVQAWLLAHWEKEEVSGIRESQLQFSLSSWVIVKRGRTRCSPPTGLILNYKGRPRNTYKNIFQIPGREGQ